MTIPLTILLAHPGAAWSTHDVYVGMKAGLEANGHRVIPYRLDEALAFYSGVFEAAEKGGLQWGNAAGQRPNVFGFAGMKAIAELVNVWPDMFISVSGHNMHYSVPVMAKKLGIPTAVYCTESPYFGDSETAFAKHYDVIFTNERRSVPQFAKHSAAFYLPHAYNPQVHYPGEGDASHAADVFFVGSGFAERRRLFRAVDWEGVNFVTRGFLWEDGESAEVLDAEKIEPNEIAAQWYRSSKINLNHHRTTTVYGAGKHISGLDADSLGPRAYEIAACQGFQLCDDSRPELREIFGDTVPTYRSHSALDLEKKIRYYLDRPGEREELARQQYLAIAPHSWYTRAREMLETIQAVMEQKPHLREVAA